MRLLYFTCHHTFPPQAGIRGSYALMQVDGNLVVRSSSFWPLWASGTSDNPKASLSLGNNGVVQIVNRNGKRVWKIGTPSKSANSPVDSNDFASLDGEAVHILFLLISPPDLPGDHLRGLESISRHLRNPNFCNFLRQAQTSTEVVELLEEADNNQLD